MKSVNRGRGTYVERSAGKSAFLGVHGEILHRASAGTKEAGVPDTCKACKENKHVYTQI